MGVLSRFVKSGERNHEVFATWVALGILFLYWCLGFIVASVKRIFGRKDRASKARSCVETSGCPATALESLIKESELRKLLEELDEVDQSSGNWSVVLDKRNDGVSYFAKRREPKDGGPTEYLSTTTFENCTAELLRDFYMDNEFRLQWDSTVLKHEQLTLCLKSGTEVGRTVKKFPLMMAREYVLAWRLWKAAENTYFCVIKACEHPAAPRRQEFKRVKEYLSGWRIQAVPGSNACEVKMLHREDIGVGKEMAKMAFSRGIWSYVNKMEHNLRAYKSSGLDKRRKAKPDAVTLCNEIPLELQRKDFSASSRSHSQSYGGGSLDRASQNRSDRHKPVSFLMQSVFLLGWAVVLGHGSSSIGSKVAAAVFMNKAVRRRRQPPRGGGQQPCRYISKSFSIHR
ncbi:hypothetical protein SELMODRAFT_270291 [Selaginella moellendorffii]|uniref:START domain-containing protein n=1 Tax=Selaginella moellendorffii TaxID=88036 RepID=D8QT23_SELML|nr:uncharacterized protein LOC9646937 [Selaginella moellendorffii]EFJ37542.1 hypothetical protein SELMODRAFT_270291 [Selaginella moellendorffii]|eukprot:XP_024538895.1 uncharacterized protein LOC9646937 [Selaginella moellendorffii]